MYAIALDDSRLIETWDRAAALERPWRELALLEGASGVAVDELSRLSIGERDRLLLALQIGTFGSRLDCETRCPSCGTRLEISADATELVVAPREINTRELELADDEWTVRFRLPDSRDIAAAATVRSDDVLAERCIAVIDASGETLSGAIPPRIRERVAERMAVLDPQADVSLDISCAGCGHRWLSPFDPAAYLFRELDAQVSRLTAEVHQLARAYGWSEASILAMGSVRRRRYLSLLVQ